MKRDEIFGREYFTHSVHARHDSKCRALIRKGYGWYGRYWVLLECLASDAVPLIDVTDADARTTLSEELGFDAGGCRLEEFLGELARLGLIDAELYHGQGHVVSEALCRRLDYIDTKREQGRKGMAARWRGKEAAETR